MSTYIGARYVPKFMGTYDATQAYENMVVVDNGMGTSYISTKPTPAGTPLTDSDYWAIYGASSGAIINLQNQIDDINDDLDFLHDNRLNNNRRVVVITDSYGKGRGGQVPFTTPLQGFLGVANDDYFAFAEGGMGFVQNGEDGNTALQLLTSKSNDITDHDTITDVIFALGINDATSAVNTIASAITAAVAYTKTTYPGAKIHIAYIGYEARDSFNVVSNYLPSLAAYIDTSSELGVHFLHNVEYVMHYRDFFISDNVHPTTAAGEYLAAAITEAVNFGSANVKIQVSSSFSETDSNTGVTVVVGTPMIDNNITNFYLNLDLGSGITLTGYNYTTVANLTGRPPIAPCIGKAVVTQAYAIDSNNIWNPILIRWYNQTVEINPLVYGSINVAGSIRGVQLFSAPTVYC